MPAITVGLPAALTSPQPARDVACEASTVDEALRAVVEQAPQYEQRIFYGDRLLVVVTLERHATCRRARSRRPAWRPATARPPAAGRRRLTPPAPPAARSVRRHRPRGVSGAARRAGRRGTVRLTTKEGRAVKLWATRETRSELMLACLRVLMGAIFLAVWSDNLIKGYYSPSGWADFVQHYADTTKVGLYADVLNTVMIPNSTVFAYGQFAHRVRGLRAVPGARPLHAGLGAAGRALPAEPAGRDVGHRRTGRARTSSCSCCCWPSASRRPGRTLGLDALLARRNPHPRLPVY